MLVNHVYLQHWKAVYMHTTQCMHAVDMYSHSLCDGKESNLSSTCAVYMWLVCIDVQDAIMQLCTREFEQVK